MNDSQTLLAEYVRNGSEAAFRELVARYVDLVHSAALRVVNGNPHLAEDVTQTVFVGLARMGGALSPDVLIGGWLHRHTCFVARRLLRTEQRRQRRERHAAVMNTVFSLPEPESSLGPFMPVLDDAINRLSAPDRAAIVLRFFEQRDFRSVAQAIGSTEDAARKRVDRALDKLHLLLKKRGVVFPSTALAAGLATEAVVAAPAGMASGIAGAALATAAAGSGSVVATLVNLIAGANLKAAATGAVVLVTAVVAPLVIHHNVRMADKDQALRLQTEQLAQLRSDNEQLAEWLAIMDAGEPPTSEVLRLRNEVGLLRREVSEMQTFGNLQTQYQAARSGVLEQVVAEGILLSNEERTIGFPRELWRFSGYGTPKAAVQSMLWAASQGDGTAYLNGYTAKARQVNLRNRWQGLTEAEVGAERRAVMEKVTHFSVFSNRYSPLDSSEISEITQVSIGLRPHGEHATGQALSINYSMIRDGDEWKCCNETRTVRVRSAPTQP